MQSQLFIKPSFLFSRFDLCLKTIMSLQSDISNLNILSLFYFGFLIWLDFLFSGVLAKVQYSVAGSLCLSVGMHDASFIN